MALLTAIQPSVASISLSTFTNNKNEQMLVLYEVIFKVIFIVKNIKRYNLRIVRKSTTLPKFYIPA
jgi:hypothetical protein